MHGESIGGMVACHVARNYPVDALVCDRTFATLDATAARLMVSFSANPLICTFCS
jgi:chorismate synthase